MCSADHLHEQTHSEQRRSSRELQHHEHWHTHLRPHTHNHADVHEAPSRRDFLRILMGGALAGVSILELAFHRAAWARASSPNTSPDLFDIQKVAEGVYIAQARPQAEINSNAAIFVGSRDVVVVDAHSKPSAAASLIRQIKYQITEKPVRYVINTHFHWDHTQGNHAYRVANEKVDFIASTETKRLMSELAVSRVKASLEQASQQIDQLRTRASRSSSQEEKVFCAGQISQVEAYRAELQNYEPELPTITFDQSYIIQDKAHDLHVSFHGHAHTSGDVVVHCPQKRAVATGDVIHGFLPFIADGFPKTWPGAIDSIGQLEFNHIIPGHASLQTGRAVMTSLRNYIEELTEKVEQGRAAGKSVTDLQKTIAVSSLKSLQSNGYADLLIRNNDLFNPHFGKLPPLQDGVNTNIQEIYNNLDRT
jgi:cyclase